eukprot:TRINITY_DN24684_c0_g1_i3.p1 TRINITY_DN24684_c0_g1~~TRINITY_DN24684_c0_g1_i3.p1  ORF type:complete len:621 (-),score=104.49 TRINITY_DN24684_c0_g1_i3:489-2351(-)
MIPSPSAIQNDATITVHLASGDELRIDVHPDMTFEELRKDVETLLVVGKELQEVRLLLGADEVRGDVKILSGNLNPADVVQAVLLPSYSKANDIWKNNILKTPPRQLIIPKAPPPDLFTWGYNDPLRRPHPLQERFQQSLRAVIVQPRLVGRDRPSRTCLEILRALETFAQLDSAPTGEDSRQPVPCFCHVCKASFGRQAILLGRGLCDFKLLLIGVWDESASDDDDDYAIAVWHRIIADLQMRKDLDEHAEQTADILIALGSFHPHAVVRSTALRGLVRKPETAWWALDIIKKIALEDPSADVRDAAEAFCAVPIPLHRPPMSETLPSSGAAPSAKAFPVSTPPPAPQQHNVDMAAQRSPLAIAPPLRPPQACRADQVGNPPAQTQTEPGVDMTDKQLDDEGPIRTHITLEESMQEDIRRECADIKEATLRSLADTIVCRLTFHMPSVVDLLTQAPDLEECRARVVSAGCELRPAWANGALLLVPVTHDDLLEAGMKLATHNILMLASDQARVERVLAELPRRRRPRLLPEHEAVVDTAASSSSDAVKCPDDETHVDSDGDWMEEVGLVVEKTFLTFRLGPSEVSVASAVVQSAPAAVEDWPEPVNPHQYRLPAKQDDN